MREMYEGQGYADANPSWHEGDSPWKANHVATIIKSNGLDPRTVAEIGCGTGEILLNLERAFPAAEFSGYEIAPTAYERAAPKATPHTSFHLEDALERDDLHFDVVLAIDVMEHVDDLYGFLQRLKPLGDRHVFHIPLDLSAQSLARSRPITDLRRDVGHIHYFYKETALATLRDSGYTVLDHFYTASRLELPDQARSSQLMKWPRRLAYKVRPDLAVRVLGGFSLMVLTD